jgi:CDGSH-type Zn-finger protein
MEKRYKIKKMGTGFGPHLLENAQDPSDVVALCSCGGTKNLSGFCDGTHLKKAGNGCSCDFCKKPEDRSN